jgi:leucyl aminopeptidase
MDIRFQNASGGEWSADCALVFSFEKEAPADFAPDIWDRAPWLGITPGMRDFSGKKSEQSLLYGHPDLPLSRALLVGLGSKEKCALNTFREAVAKALQTCRARSFSSIGIAVQNLDKIAEVFDQSRETLIRETVVAAKLALYHLDVYRSEPADGQLPDPARLTFLFSEKETPDPAHKAARLGEAEAAGVILARDLANGPANHVTPEVLAEECRKLARAHGFSYAALDAVQIREKGMGALWGVAQGATHEPRFIILEHCPKGKEQDDPLIFIGKGITFDSGGISLKPPAKMHEMKSDMGGAAAVLGLFRALSEMADADTLPRVIGLIPATENMPDGNATRPGDVVTTLSGKTVEILNTDAEGRLVVCDALTYAQQEWKPAVMVDLATLTGACVVALGDYGAGLFTQDKRLRRAALDAADAMGDLVWPLPLWDEYDTYLKSDVADMTNTGPREGGAINAALFLRRFVEKDTRWAHLDIAGPGWVTKAAPTLPVPGATGVGVRMLCRLLRESDAFMGEKEEKK